jgi:hypothetical protein
MTERIEGPSLTQLIAQLALERASHLEQLSRLPEVTLAVLCITEAHYRPGLSRPVLELLVARAARFEELDGDGVLPLLTCQPTRAEECLGMEPSWLILGERKDLRQPVASFT